VKLSSAAPQISRLQETHSSVTYTAEWVQADGLSFRSGGGIKGADKVGARADFAFTGTGVTWVGRRFTDTGVARVYLDGSLVATIDTTSAVQEEFQADVFTRTGLPSGAHTLTIEVIGRNGESTGATVAPVWIDAFDVYR
jgi:hypothetical protein